MSEETELREYMRDHFDVDLIPDGVFKRTRKGRGPRGYVGALAGCFKPNGHAIGINNKTYLANRLVWLWVHGSWPSDYLNHLDQNLYNNKIHNLKVSTISEIARNCKRSIKNTSGCTGVSFTVNPKHKKKPWRVGVKSESIDGYSKYFAHLADAVMMAHIKRKEFGFHPNHGSTPS